jgi:hypothetical protein
MHNVIIFCNNGLLEERDMVEIVKVIVASTTSCLKRRLNHFVRYHVFSQSPLGRRLNDKYPNIQ